MQVTPSATPIWRLFIATFALLSVSLVFPFEALSTFWSFVYFSAQMILLAASLILAGVISPINGRKGTLLKDSLPFHLVLVAMSGIVIQSVYPIWPLVPLLLFIVFPFTIFSHRPGLFWLPAAVLLTVALGRFLFSTDPGLFLWSAVFLVFSGGLVMKMSRDIRVIRFYRAQLNRIERDAKEIMGRIERHGLSAAEDRIRDMEAAITMALDEDDFLQKLLVWGCRYFNARTGILLVPDEPSYFRMRAAVHRGVRINEDRDKIPADKGFIHLARERGGILCVSNAGSTVKSLDFYPEDVDVGSFLVKVVYDTKWEEDLAVEDKTGMIGCVLYFDSARPGFFSLDRVTCKRLEEFGSLVLRAMKMSYVLHKVTVDKSAKDAISRYVENLTRSLDPERITERTIEAVMDAYPNCGGAVVMQEDDGLSIVCSAGEAVKDLSSQKILRDEPSQIGLLLRRFAEAETGDDAFGGYRAGIVIDHEMTRPSPFFYRGERLGKIVSFIAIPSFMPDEKGRLILKAVIAAVSCHKDPVKAKEVEDLRTIAGMMAPALDNALQHRRVNELSRTDGLTGLLNHKTFQIVLDGKINRVNRGYDPSLAVIMVDGDHFKNVNDTYGHPVGDEVLVELARRLKAGVRVGDAVARYGGEEFAIALDNVDEKTARQITEKMRKAIASKQFHTNAGPVDMTASFGFSVIRGKGGDSKEELLEKADRALYYAKESGRNCVVGYGDLLESESPKIKSTQTKTGSMNQEEWQW
jgi:diguanylate cyclase (GGDEF)-like protein